jgi:hypothetical protein
LLVFSNDLISFSLINPPCLQLCHRCSNS